MYTITKVCKELVCENGDGYRKLLQMYLFPLRRWGACTCSGLYSLRNDI